MTCRSSIIIHQREGFSNEEIRRDRDVYYRRKRIKVITGHGIMKYIKISGILIMFLLFLPFTGLSQDRHAIPPTSFKEVADYVKKHQRLPDNFITKKDARRLGWDPSRGNLRDVAPGKSIGGDMFRNRENKLPAKKGRVWFEADIHYNGGKRGKDRIVFSNDGLIYKTEDHYRTFSRID